MTTSAAMDAISSPLRAQTTSTPTTPTPILHHHLQLIATTKQITTAQHGEKERVEVAVPMGDRGDQTGAPLARRGEPFWSSCLLRLGVQTLPSLSTSKESE